jgi:D-3-phosphoglycerate dehydrogenase
MEILFIDTVHPVLMDRLQKSGFVCIDATKKTISEIHKALGTAFGIVIRSRFTLNEEFLIRAPKLKFIARSGAGLENIDQEYCKQKNIRLFNSPEGNRNAVAEHALGMLLSLMNHLHFADQQVRKGLWQREINRGEELDGKTVGIIGYGNNGNAFAKKLKGFDVKVLAYDKYKTGFGDHFVQEATLEAILQSADVVSLHIPYNKETHYLIDKKFIVALKKPIYLLNLSRGKIVKTEDLVSGLMMGQIKGAGLDVLEYESKSFEAFFEQELPDAFSYLIKNYNVILSPHVGGWSVESYYLLSSILADKILEVDWESNL